MNERPELSADIPVFTDPSLLDTVAGWLERRVDETVGWRHRSRLYGLTFLDRLALGHDGAGAMRITFLAEGDVYDLLAGPSAVVATTYDALGLCCFGTATHLDTLVRRRCRTVVVANRSGLTAVNRMRGDQPECLGPPSGPVAEIVAELFGMNAHDGRPPAHVA